MKIKVFKKGFNYSQDGVGNRLVYHLQGCNMHCPWCTNPEGITKDGTLMVNKEWLIDSVCPYGAIHDKQVDRSMCDSCITNVCINMHRNKGIRLSCEEYKIDEIIEEVKRSSVLFYDGGGVTLSGGEPTQQFDTISVLLERLKSIDIHTTIETNATHSKLEELFAFIDLLIMDFKHYDHDTCACITGVGNQVITENINKALTSHSRVLIRIPIIKGFNNLEYDARSFVAFFKQFSTENASFEFLPYHEYGKSKWLQCGMSYNMKDAFIGGDTIDLYETIFSQSNLTVIRT